MNGLCTICSTSSKDGMIVARVVLTQCQHVTDRRIYHSNTALCTASSADAL